VSVFNSKPRALGALLTLVVFAFQAAPAGAQSHIDSPLLRDLALKSSAALVVDQDTGEMLAAKNADAVQPVASLTKLMTALVVLDSGLSLDEELVLTTDDVDRIKRTPSRLPIGTRLTRDELLLLALMASENRAALALSRNYPGGTRAFVARMNSMARELGMHHTRFSDAAGLSSGNLSTAHDLLVLMNAAAAQPLIRAHSTQPQYTLRVGSKRRRLSFINSNRLVRRHGQWDIDLQKTGYTNEAGRCLVMQARVANRRLSMIFLDSVGKLTRYGDASRVRASVERFDRTKALAGSP
jgi:D-alanyl-D-alanine endopeptidase (penicillin-binding protein 7)